MKWSAVESALEPQPVKSAVIARAAMSENENRKYFIGREAMDSSLASDFRAQERELFPRARTEIQRYRRGRLLADAMLQLPDAQGGEQKAFGARERPDRGHFSDSGILNVVFPGTTTARLGFAGAARFLAHGEVACVVHAR